MEKEKIALYRNSYRCGDIVITYNPADSGKELVKVRIWGIHPKYAIVTNDRYRWCIHWTELMLNNP